ncbi:killer cell lectin-like receptor subfamily F member 1 [Pleurodeles waltl]|uniref:killer cell lectin-like receptor subfamily F member 1 n=1 Tax=Pleurodeles waltl TaxID=8319 RepID=UPI00370999EC
MDWKSVAVALGGVAVFQLGIVIGLTSVSSLCQICPYSWILLGGRCYFFSEEFKSWNSSQEYCASRFSDLITIDDQNEMDLVETVAKNSLYTWIGLRYSDITMDWRWMNGSRLQTGSLTLKDNGRGGRCGAFRSKEIQPDDCITKSRWICEKKVIQTSS